jgi:hypothetical protein
MDLVQPSTFSGLEKVHKYLGCALTFHQLNARSLNLLANIRLSNDKPSAIFRLRSAFSSTSAPPSGMSTPSAFTSATLSSVPGQVTAILGFALEPLEAIAAQLAALPQAQTQNAMNITPTSTPTSSLASIAKPADPSVFAEKIARHLFNYIAGFVPAGTNVGPDSTVSMGVIARWYESFIGKVRAGGTGFLERNE